MLEKGSLSLLAEALETLEKGFANLPSFEPSFDQAAVAGVLTQVAERMQDNYPYPHPLYAGQMLKPPHPVARLAYMLALYINPNNHALDGGRASSAMEKEAVAEIAQMFGWGNDHLGHLTSGGTMANLEALWVSGRIHPDKTVLASEQAHYTHGRITEVLGIPFEAVKCDANARMDISALETRLAQGGVGTVVVTLGTTGVGALDPLHEVLKLRQQFDFRIHVDSAYGGYFGLAENLTDNGSQAFAAISKVDSIVIDPHKHGLQPYGCGCVLFKDVAVGAIYKHDSPYTYFSSDELHLGEISLECSRAGASAVALWATQQLLPMKKGGEFAKGLESGREAALALSDKIKRSEHDLGIFEPELDIVVWAPIPEPVQGASERIKASQISRLSQQLFIACEQRGLHLAVMKLPAELLREYWPDVEFDEELVSCMRSCLMKPEHQEYVGDIWAIYQAARTV